MEIIYCIIVRESSTSPAVQTNESASEVSISTKITPFEKIDESNKEVDKKLETAPAHASLTRDFLHHIVESTETSETLSEMIFKVHLPLPQKLPFGSCDSHRQYHESWVVPRFYSDSAGWNGRVLLVILHMMIIAIPLVVPFTIIEIMSRFHMSRESTGTQLVCIMLWYAFQELASYVDMIYWTIGGGLQAT
ncbi:uncharacterized protein LAESUDRAFT_715508 [Laetiporus sulphureus 93-53]|uniref:Uncharacterized protein n=1 Tax=Laetiporus sulphureus 93-53 TaxID=1314785 RepID=A0A165DAT7_9APHY|nr:uncharacterized protein LAESUDRAFT_715508 [Laetiporus sulphureus 93-53]KZT04450.1 hypothetical protein LAESUDRAFT_715508 [Laetiporus sulphureus 93-53]